MASLSSRFNPRIEFINNTSSLSSQEYKQIITSTINELCTESQNAAILMNKLRLFNNNIVITNKDPSPFATNVIYPKIIYPERGHTYDNKVVIVIPINYNGFIDSVEPLVDYNNSNIENKSLIYNLHTNKPLKKEIDYNTLIKFKIIKKLQHFKIYFAHELIHAYHYFYRTFNDMNKHLEEAAVIYGLENFSIKHKNKKIYITENIIRSDYGFYPRISHNFERSL